MSSLVITELNSLEMELSHQGNVKGGLMVMDSKLEMQGDVSRIIRGPLRVSSTTSFTDNSSEVSSSGEATPNRLQIPISVPSGFSLPKFSYF